MLYLYYGLDGENCLDYDEIADKYNVDIDEVDNIMEMGINNLKKALKENVESLSNNKYSELLNKWGEEKVNNALEQLDVEYKNLIKEYYISGEKITIKNLAEKYSMAPATLHYRLNQGVKMITNIIENKSKSVFYQKFESFSK